MLLSLIRFPNSINIFNNLKMSFLREVIKRCYFCKKWVFFKEGLRLSFQSLLGRITHNDITEFKRKPFDFPKNCFPGFFGKMCQICHFMFMTRHQEQQRSCLTIQVLARSHFYDFSFYPSPRQCCFLLNKVLPQGSVF